MSYTLPLRLGHLGRLYVIKAIDAGFGWRFVKPPGKLWPVLSAGGVKRPVSGCGTQSPKTTGKAWCTPTSGGRTALYSWMKSTSQLVKRPA